MKILKLSLAKSFSPRALKATDVALCTVYRQFLTPRLPAAADKGPPCMLLPMATSPPQRRVQSEGNLVLMTSQGNQQECKISNLQLSFIQKLSSFQRSSYISEAVLYYVVLTCGGIWLEQCGLDPSLLRGHGILSLGDGAHQPPVAALGVQHMYRLVLEDGQLLRTLPLDLGHGRVRHTHPKQLPRWDIQHSELSLKLDPWTPEMRPPL